WCYLFFIWPLLFSYSRLYLGVHYPSDILVGTLVGVSIALLAYRYLYLKRVVETTSSILLRVRPSLMGSSTVSTLGSSFNFLLNSNNTGVLLSFGSNGSTTLPLQSTLSERIIPFGATLSITKSK